MGREELAALGHEGAAQSRDGFGSVAANVLLVEQDLAGLGAQQAGNRLQQSGLACAIGTDDGHYLAGRDVDRHPAQDLEIAVAGFSRLRILSIVLSQ